MQLLHVRWNQCFELHDQTQYYIYILYDQMWSTKRVFLFAVACRRTVRWLEQLQEWHWHSQQTTLPTSRSCNAPLLELPSPPLQIFLRGYSNKFKQSINQSQDDTAQLLGVSIYLSSVFV